MRTFTRTQILVSLMAFIFALVLAAPLVSDDAEARSRSGGRSFSSSRSIRKSAPPPQQAPQRSRADQPAQRTSAPGTGSSFLRGLGGGLLGGFLGSMLFGGIGHATGMGGFGGSGIGLFEILILGGIAYFLYRRFARRPREAPIEPYGYSQPVETLSESERPRPIDTRGMAFSTSGPDGTPRLSGHGPDLDPEAFKEFAQDVFFKVQAAWTRRDIAVMREFLGQDLLREYEGHFQELREKGEINRLENIAVRKVEIVDSGEMDGEEFVIVRFTANLLDYTVEEATGKVVEGDPTEPVKFDEKWAFARPKGATRWRLEGIQPAD